MPQSAGCRFLIRAATGSSTGVSWTDAYTDLQDALSDCTSTDEIWIAKGIYKPHDCSGGCDVNATFTIPSGCEVYGGFVGTETSKEDRDPIANVTVLYGKLDASNNSRHVVTMTSADNTTHFVGLKVMRGHGGTGADGAGMIITGGAPNITDCIFAENDARRGGGIYNTGDSTITNCTFRDNMAGPGDTQGGGGIYNISDGLKVTGCLFDGNDSGTALTDGGAIVNYLASSVDTVEITNCVFIDNIGDAGGAIFNDSPTTGSVTVDQCTFTRNRSRLSIGTGGIHNEALVSLTVTNSSFFENNRRAIWSGASNTHITNCLFSGNHESNGGAIHVQGTTSITNCTFSGNEAYVDGGAIYWTGSSSRELTITNCVMWGNEDDSIPPLQIFELPGSGNVTVTYSDIDDGDPDDLICLGGSNDGNVCTVPADCPGGSCVDNILFGGAANNNIDDDPEFVRNPDKGPDGFWGSPDDDFGDLHIASTSPSLDKANNSAIPTGITTDLDGNDRTIDGDGDSTATVDMGAYERCDVDADCDDDEGCTTDTCVTGICQHNFCSGSTPFCVSDSCEACVVDSDCDDANDCTTDACNGSNACTHTNVTSGTACEDGLFCTTGDTCDGAGTCDSGTSGNPCTGRQICCECGGVPNGQCQPTGPGCECPVS